MSLAIQSTLSFAAAHAFSVPTIVEGHGPAVVFLHGAPDHKGEWREVIAELKPAFRCYAPDLPGFGAAQKPPAPYDFSIGAQVSFFDHWVKQTVGDEPFILVMHDIGAIMGMAWAASHQQQVRGIVVMNTVLHSDFVWHTMARIWRSPLLGRLFMLILNRFAYRLAFGRDFPQVRRDQIDSMYDGLTPVARQSMLRHFRQMTQPDFFDGWEAKLTAVPQRIPTTVLWGAQDPLIPLSDANRLGGKLVMLEDCGHWVPLEKAERVAAEIMAVHQATQ